MATETYIIDTVELFERLKTYFEKTSSPFISFDVETDSNIEKLAKLYGIGLCANDKKGFYIPWRNPDGSETWPPELQISIIGWFTDLVRGKYGEKYLIGHNAIFDVLVLYYNWDVDFSENVYSDTILSSHLLDEEQDLGLKDLAVKEFGPEAILPQELLKQNVLEKGGKWLKNQKDFYLADTAVLGNYCAQDTILTYKLFCLNEDRLKKENLYDFFYKDETMPLYKLVTIPMKQKGFPVDVEHFKRLNQEIDIDITKLETEIRLEIEPEVYSYVQKILDEDVPVMNTGDFPKDLAELSGIPLPINKKTGSITLAAKAIDQQELATPEHKDFYGWIRGKTEICPVPKMEIKKCQEKIWFRRNEGRNHIFNLKSNDDLSYYFFEVKKIKPLSYTDKGKPQVNEDFFDSISSSDSTVNKLLEYKKLQKIKNTYFEGILERQIDGIIYTDMLQFGTVSGRYSSRNPNLQNLPKTKEDDEVTPLILKYTNAIKQGFIAPKGYSIVDADMQALEPRCFCHISNEKKLQDVFKKGEDLYSRIAIDVFKAENVSAYESDSNYLKKIEPRLRQQSKVFALQCVYGSSAYRVAESMNCEYKEADRIIRQYLRTYPNLKKYMQQQELEVMRTGQVKTIFGRIRHLPEAKQLYDKYGLDLLNSRWAKSKGLSKERRRFKNFLNLAKNFPVQSLGASLMNRASIKIAKQFKEQNIEGYQGLQVHDQLCSIVKQEQAEQVVKIVKDAMENTNKISVPLIAEPKIANNLKDSH